MTEVQPLAWKMVPVSLKAKLYYHPDDGNCFEGKAQYQDPQASNLTKQIVLSGKHLNATPTLEGHPEIVLESVDALLQIDFSNFDLINADLLIQDGEFQIFFNRSLDPEHHITPSVMWGKIRTVNSEFIINTVQSTDLLSVSTS